VRRLVAWSRWWFGDSMRLLLTLSATFAMIVGTVYAERAFAETDLVLLVKHVLIVMLAVASMLVSSIYIDILKQESDLEEIKEMLRELKGREPN